MKIGSKMKNDVKIIGIDDSLASVDIPKVKQYFGYSTISNTVNNLLRVALYLFNNDIKLFLDLLHKSNNNNN